MSIDFPKEEERILKRWEEIDAFLTQVELVCHSVFQHAYNWAQYREMTNTAITVER